jgi:hypothetical protein
MRMPGDLNKQNWMMLSATTPFIAGLIYLAIYSIQPAQSAVPVTRDVSFKVVFDERVSFPQTIRQSTIKRLLGPEYEIVMSAGEQVAPEGESTADPATTAWPSGAGSVRDCVIDDHGGLLTLRVPQAANSADIAARLGQLGRIKLITVYMKK